MPPLNAVQILTECGSCLRTGCLTVFSKDVEWRIFFNEGELQYADSSVKDLSQLQYIFLKNGWSDALKILKGMPKEQETHEANPAEDDFDQAMAWIWLHEGLNLEQVKQLVKEISLDALENFLWLQEGTTKWLERRTLPSWIQASVLEKASLDLAHTLKSLNQRLKSWQHTPSSIHSPHQRPYLLDFKDIHKPVNNGTLSTAALEQLAGLLTKGLSFRQLSLYLKQDEIRVAGLLRPYIEDKVIHLRPPNHPFDKLPKIIRDDRFLAKKVNQPSTSYQHKIICIDDSPTMLTEMKRFLNTEKYDVTTIDDPIKASATIFKMKPDLILLDITMPKINGYSLCSLLRNSSSFDNTPIIMVSGNTGLIDKARAKICGATAYLTKPFTQQELLSIVDKHLCTAHEKAAA